MIERINKILWGLFLLTFPFSIRFLVYEEASYRFGNFNPWVSGFIYATEILLVITFLLWCFQQLQVTSYKLRIKNLKSKIFNIKFLLIALFLINALVVTVLKGDVVLGAIFIMRMCEAGMIAYLISSEVITIRQTVTILLFAAALQMGWGYLQWQMNHGLGLSRLGEAFIGPEVAGVAKIDLIDGTKQIRPYGSFLHPNILAAYLMTILFVALPYLKKNGLFWIVLLTGGIFFTHSLAGILVTCTGLVMYLIFRYGKSIKFRKAVKTLILLLLIIVNGWIFLSSKSIQLSNSSWQERLDQNKISEEMIKSEPLGVGARNFTLEMERFSDIKLLPWEFQPVHNTYFLIMNETGVQGLMLMIIMILYLFIHHWKKGTILPLFMLILIAPFDHFLWDSFSGMMLVGIVLGFFVFENNKKHI